EYYRHYLLPEMQEEERNANTALVEVLKDGRRRVTKKALMKKYGADKLAVVQQTLKRPHILGKYKEEKDSKSTLPLTHEDISEIEKTELPDWEGILQQIKLLPV